MEKDMKSMIFSAIERTSSFKIAARMFVTTIHSKGMPSFLWNNDTFISVFQMLDLHIKIGGPFFFYSLFCSWFSTEVTTIQLPKCQRMGNKGAPQNSTFILIAAIQMNGGFKALKIQLLFHLDIFFLCCFYSFQFE